MHKKLGFEDEDLNQLIDITIKEDNEISDFREAVIDTISEFHDDKKQFKAVIEELIIVLSAAREYDNDRTAYTEKQRRLLWDTGSEVLIKALRALNKT
jgi:NACalpha-BTF3-like transcription factor